MENRNYMENSEFREFFIDEMKDIYWAEKALFDALHEVRDKVTSMDLEDAISQHIEDTAWQIELDEQIFRMLGMEPKAKKCKAMDGLLKEAREIIRDTETDSFTRDAATILALQKVEHYEIATYGTLRIFADHMGEYEIKDMLEEILNNEKDTDVILTEIAESYINEYAAEE